MSFLGDFHIHSTFSDGKLTIPEIVDLYGSHRFGAIAITDHLCESNTLIGKVSQHLGLTLTQATYPLYFEIIKSEARRAWEQYRMVVFPGFELSKNTPTNNRSTHIIGLGVTEYISADASVPVLSEKIRSNGGLVIAAHPVPSRKFEKQTLYLWSRREEFRNYFDAWEVASGSIIFPEVLESSLPKIASSDFHKPRQFNSWKTVFDCERHPEAILEAIRNQQITFHHTGATYDSRLSTWNTYNSLDGSHDPACVGNLALPRSF